MTLTVGAKGSDQKLYFKKIIEKESDWREIDKFKTNFFIVWFWMRNNKMVKSNNIWGIDKEMVNDRDI